MEIIEEVKQKLEEEVPKARNTIICPHKNPDYDALASSAGLVNICKKLGGTPYILIGDDLSKLDVTTRNFFLKIKDQFPVITMEDYLAIMTDNDLLIATDVNKSYRVHVENLLRNFKKSIIIDHHDPDEHTIDATHKFIYPKISSASEIVARLLKQYKMKFSSDLASYLYAGIRLDTGNFTSKTTSPETMETIAMLAKEHADIQYINSLFKDGFEKGQKIQLLVGGSTFLNYNIAIARGQSETYTTEDLAKAASQLLGYDGVDASFAIGSLGENKIGISGRSEGKIDVGNILGELGGGGNSTSAATIIEGPVEEIENTSKQLKLLLTPGNNRKKETI